MDNQKEEFPSIKEQGKNLAKFTFEVVKDSVLNIGVTEGEVFASDELKKERMDICKKCEHYSICLLYTSPSPRDQRGSRMPSSA